MKKIILAVAIGFVMVVLLMMATALFGKYKKIETVVLADGIKLDIFSERSWELTQILYCSVEVDGEQAIPKFSWVFTDPKYRPYNFVVYREKGNRYFAVVESGTPNAVVLIYDKQSNSVWAQLAPLQNRLDSERVGVAMHELNEGNPNLYLYAADKIVDTSKVFLP